jgi:hypothetical protein
VTRDSTPVLKHSDDGQTTTSSAHPFVLFVSSRPLTDCLHDCSKDAIIIQCVHFADDIIRNKEDACRSAWRRQVWWDVVWTIAVSYSLASPETVLFPTRLTDVRLCFSAGHLLRCSSL